MLDFPGLERMPDGFGRLAAALVPGARPPMQLGQEVRLLVLQTCEEHVSEQVMVAIPLATIVERHEEHIRLDRALQHRLPVRVAGDSVGRWPAQPGQDRRSEEELSDGIGLALQDLLDQVVDDVAIVAREACDELGRVSATLHRERGELEGCDPAFGARLEHRDVRRRQVQAHHLVQVGDCLLCREPEVARADLGEPATRAQAGQRECWIGACGDHQVDVRR